jgi:hypothetical protein
VLSTKAWATSHGISTDPTAPAIADYSKKYPRSARQIAVRAVILQGIVAVAAKVDPQPIVRWFHQERIWRSVTSHERKFLQDKAPSEKDVRKFAWHAEAEWTLLWVINKVESLGLPTQYCDTRRLIDEIIPPLGSDISEFVDTAELQSPGALLAEDDRTYNLWCYAHSALRQGQPLPKDLNMGVLYERRYAFEWLDGNQKWDDVTCDS